MISGGSFQTMRNWVIRFCMILVLSHGLTTALFAWQEADSESSVIVQEVLERYVEEMGGEMVLRAIGALKVDIKYESASEGKGTACYQEGKKLVHQELETGSTYTELFDKKQWSVNNLKSEYSVLTTQENIDAKEAKVDLPTDAIRLLDQLERFTVVPKAKYENGQYASCVCLELKDKDESNVYRFFDPETGLLVRVERYGKRSGLTDPSQIMRTNIFYEEFDGIKFVSRSESSTESSDWKRINVYSNFQIEPRLSDSVFEIEK